MGGTRIGDRVEDGMVVLGGMRRVLQGNHLATSPFFHDPVRMNTHIGQLLSDPLGPFPLGKPGHPLPPLLVHKRRVGITDLGPGAKRKLHGLGNSVHIEARACPVGGRLEFEIGWWV
jgi:hypothetical protein